MHPRFDARINKLREATPKREIDHAARGGHDPGMADPITRTELDSKFEAMRADAKAEFTALRGDMKAGFAELRTEFAEDRTANVKWIVATGIGMTALVLTGVGVLNTVQRAGSGAPAQAAPIVIYAQPTPPSPAASR